jgi:hypothetical protein
MHDQLVTHHTQSACHFYILTAIRRNEFLRGSKSLRGLEMARTSSVYMFSSLQQFFQRSDE